MSIVEKTSRVADKALELTLNRLNAESSAAIPTLALVSMADKALERLGYGVKPQVNNVVNNVNGVQQNAYMPVPADVIRDSQARMREAQNERANATPAIAPPVEGEAVPVLDLVASEVPASES